MFRNIEFHFGTIWNVRNWSETRGTGPKDWEYVQNFGHFLFWSWLIKKIIYSTIGFLMHPIHCLVTPNQVRIFWWHLNILVAPKINSACEITFWNSCFGRWLDITKVDGDPLVLHYVFCHEVIMDTQCEVEEIVFEIGCYEISFGKK